MSTIEHAAALVQAGACVDAENKFVRCAVDPLHCSSWGEGYFFKSSRELHDEGASLASGCLGGFKTERVQMGRCMSQFDEKVCAGTPDACLVPDEYAEFYGGCRLPFLELPHKKVLSLYPACVRTDRNNQQKVLECIWGPNDCTLRDGDTASPVYQVPVEAKEAQCTCDKVKTGACKHNARYYCAVSEEACDDDSVWYDAFQLSLGRGGPGIECSLCKALPKDAEMPFGLQFPEKSSTSSSGSGRNETAVIVGIVVGAVVVSVMVVIFVRKRVAVTLALKLPAVES